MKNDSINLGYIILYTDYFRISALYIQNLMIYSKIDAIINSTISNVLFDPASMRSLRKKP